MIILLFFLAAGIVVGRVRGGTLGRLGEAHLSWTPIIFVGVVLQGTAAYIDVPAAATGLALASHLAVFAFAAFNAKRPGMTLLAFGGLLNFLVVAANGAMPVSPSALVRAGLGTPAVGFPDVGGLHEILTDQSRLRFLADVIPIRPLRHVVSPGDLALWTGLLLAVQGLMVGPGRRVLGARRPPGPKAAENTA